MLKYKITIPTESLTEGTGAEICVNGLYSISVYSANALLFLADNKDKFPSTESYELEVDKVIEYNGDLYKRYMEKHKSAVMKLISNFTDSDNAIILNFGMIGDKGDIWLEFNVDDGIDDVTDIEIKNYGDLVNYVKDPSKLHFTQAKINSFHDIIVREFEKDFMDGNINRGVRNFTFQVTEGCNLRCSYCYQTCKTNNNMSLEIGKQCVDSLLSGEYEYLNKSFSHGIILEFIGGDPLMEIELIQDIYEYFLQETYRLDHPWFRYHRLSLCSNGELYFNELVSKFFDKYGSQISFNISIDGNKKLHDSCRLQPDGEGSYDIGIAGVHHYTKYRKMQHSSKMTLAPSNIPFIFESIVSLIDNGYCQINLNVVFEDVWCKEDATCLYNQLKLLADYITDNDLYYIGLSIFAPRQTEEDPYNMITNGCGGNGAMLAIDYEGNCHPCIRYMNSSLNHEQPRIVMNNISESLKYTPETLKKLDHMDKITHMSKLNDRCISCPLDTGCTGCSGYDYQKSGTVNYKCTYICDMIKAEHLASIYYWNKLRLKYPNFNIEFFDIQMNNKEVLEIISETELENLKYIVELSKNSAPTYTNTIERYKDPCDILNDHNKE